MSDLMAAAKPASLNTSEPLYATCTACHGENGEGKQWLGAPKISGQHDWYLKRQLKNWQDGIRGTHPKDVYGIQMRSMSMVMANDQEIDKVVSYIGGLNSPKPPATIKGDLQAGQNLYATCVACHGPGGMGNKALNSPKIAGLPDWYVARQLWGFKNGLRGENPRDVYGQQMRPMAMALPDEEAINNISAYIATFDGTGEAPAITTTVAASGTTDVSSTDTGAKAITVAAVNSGGSAEAGAALYTTCIACHGADGAGNQALNSPRIAGQSAWYLTNQLKGFKAGYRGSKPEDIYGMQMRPMSMTLATIRQLPILQRTSPPSTEQFLPRPWMGMPKQVKGFMSLVSPVTERMVKVMRHSNHQPDRPQDWYVVRQLQNFKAGIRGTHPEDINGQTMRPMSMTLADDKAMKDVAAYIISLRK